MTTQGGKPSSLEKYGMLLMGVFLIILAGGRFVTPAAAFLAPVFLLMFTRNTGIRHGAMVLYALLFLSLLVRLHGYVPEPKPIFLTMVACFAAIETLPYLIDRKVSQKLPTAVVPFVLPVVVVSLGYIVSVALPFGVANGAAYTQSDNKELLQLASSTGIHGITFLIFWFASTMASLWDSGFAWRRCRKQFLPMSVVLMIVFVGGGYRIIFADNESGSVRVAGVVANQSALWQSLAAADVVDAGGSGTPDEALRSAIYNYQNELFALTRKEAVAGARIISWAEASGIVLEADTAGFIDRAKALADQQDIYLAADLAVLASGEFRQLVFDPDGNVIVDRRRADRQTGLLGLKGQKPLESIETEYGNVVFASGLDLHSARAMRQAGSTIDLIVAQARDWKTSAPHLSTMAMFRGVENGASLLRVVESGRLMVSDELGRILAQTDYEPDSSQSIVASVKQGGRTALYNRFSDWFAWLCVLLAALVLYQGLLRRRLSR